MSSFDPQRFAMILLTVLLLFSLAIVDAGIINEKNGYKVGCVVCHPLDKEKINIHLIPHSHDDVGWVKTVDEYYYGLNSEGIENAISVQNIISSVVEELLRNPDRRYIQVETAFFYKWWKEQNEDMRNSFRQLVNNGQLEIASGGWSMNDEACTNYQSTIDQFTLGLKKIEETVGKCGRSKIGWQIDPFGHSREQASILRQLGYDGIFFARLDHSDFTNRKNKHRMDFAWKLNDNLDNNILFGSIFPKNGYGAPTDFCFDIICNDDQIVDNPDSILYNINKKVEEFATALDEYAAYYDKDDKNILVTMGDDFQYQAAGFNYRNLDLLIKGFKNHSKYHLLYSTPSCYMKAVNDANISLTLKTDDFFPYSDDEHSFWGGYFTSRPNIKRFERTGHNILQATKQMYALYSDSTYDSQLEDLKEAMGVLQHHDAITGTEKQAVSNDYVRMLTAAIKKAEKPVGDIIGNILQSKTNLNLTLSSCLLANISICSTSQQNKKFVVAVYNPLAWKTKHYIRLPVEDGQYVINGPDGIENYQLINSLSTFSFVDLSGKTPSKYELLFAAKEIPPMGFKIYHIQKLSTKATQANRENTKLTSFQLDETTHLLKNVTINNVTLDITQNFFYYTSSDGCDNENNCGISSGAYIFRPKSSTPTVLPTLDLSGQFSGELVEEVHQKWHDKNVDVHQSIRWYKEENYIEFNWLLGNIDIYNDATGKEVISRFEISNFDNKNVFYTDSNGRETIKRVKNQRLDYAYNSSVEPVSGNYYPVTSKIVIKDLKKNIEVAVLNDRSQGGSSLENNQTELMLHRRLLSDDSKGVGENLDETEFNGLGMYTRGSHYLIVGKANGVNSDGKTTAAQERILAQKILLQPWVGLSPTQMSFEDLKNQIDLQYTALHRELPENINILSFEKWSDTSYLLRLENIMENNEYPILSSTSNVNIMTLFKKLKIKDITETTLGATVPLSELNKETKLTWNIAKQSVALNVSAGNSKTERKVTIKDAIVSLSPMEIRTFILSTKDSNSGTGRVLVNIFMSTFSLTCLFLFKI